MAPIASGAPARAEPPRAPEHHQEATLSAVTSDLPWEDAAEPTWAPHPEPMGRAQQRVDLERRRKTLEAELDDVMRRIQLLKSLQMQDLEEGRIPVSFTCDGASVYLHTQMRASVGDDELAALLKRPEFKGDHLPRETINANSLSAWIRGFLPAKVKVRNEEHLRELLLAPDPAPFPPELLPHIGLTLVREVRVTGAGNGAS